MRAIMSNHPNRSKTPAPGANPKPAEIRAQREAAGLTQTEAAELVYSTLRTWQSWETEGEEQRRMHPAIWELWLLKTAHLRGKR
jgi:putative transcriptional regulator